MLVAQSIFFIAAGTIISRPVPVIALSVCGLLTVMVFTLTGVKHYWRIVWLIRRLQRVDPTYNDYMTFGSLEDLVELDSLSKWAKSILTGSDSQVKNIQWYHTGWLYTWGLGIVMAFAWFALVVYGLYELFSC
jgi:hypothetical protein